VPTEVLTKPIVSQAMRRFEYKVIDTGKRVEEELNKLGAEGWQVVGVTTKKQLLIAPPAAIILMRELARMGADAFGYTADLRIDRHLAQLLRLRVSQLNNCTYCLNLHYAAAREAGIPRAKIDTLTAWWETELHSEAEQAALRYTEALTRAADTDRDAAFQRFHDALAENFSPEEILEIVGVVVNMNVWTRIKLAEGAMPGPA
jgi:AhpD family alkylhydroperoxidase